MAGKNFRPGLFDVVFLDVRLPDGNGLDWLPRIQQPPTAPEVTLAKFSVRSLDRFP
jgi:two-component system NtrC family response regulator